LASYELIITIIKKPIKAKSVIENFDGGFDQWKNDANNKNLNPI